MRRTDICSGRCHFLQTKPSLYCSHAAQRPKNNYTIYIKELQIKMYANIIDNRKDIFIINADDYAYNTQMDKGIVELIRKGKIKSISILINGPNIKQAFNLLSELKNQQKDIYLNCSFGLHFNLTQGKPFNTDLNRTDLIENGHFIGKTQFYERIDAITEQIDKLIEVQAQMQINQFIKIFKRRPSHLDGHNHIHLVPRIAKILANILPEFGIYRVRTLNQKIIKAKVLITPKFLSNNHLSCEYYTKNEILSPKRFVGIQSFGKLDAKVIEEIFEEMQITQKYRSIELMCHPGYVDQNGPSWSANPDRLLEKKQLQSYSFEQLINQKGLSNYFDLLAEQTTFRPTILIYSKLKRGTGNQTTTLRLKNMFENLGYKVYLWNASDQLDIEVQSSDLTKFLVSFGITLILGVNVSRSAIIIYKATSKIGVPYILMIAGTDANYTFKDPTQVSQLSQALQNCQYLISLSHDMLQITQSTLKSLGLNKKIQTIVQSSCLSIQLQKQVEFKKPAKPYLLLPTSFRRVKCVHHLFRQLNQLIDEHDLHVLIAGPIIDQNYYLECLPEIRKIVYLGTLSKQLYANYLKNAFIIINSSQSQGMSCSILQAFEFGVPVIARNNSGNLQLIKHMHSGLIYQGPQQFLQLVKLLKKNDLLKQKIIKNATQLFESRYCCQRETQAYKKLLEEIYGSRLYSYDKNQQWIRVLNQPFVHSTCDVNNSLFFQIKHHVSNNSTILDMACGNGIFSLIFILNSRAEELDVYLADINFKITANAVYNFRQSSIWNRIRKIHYLTSDLFQNIDTNVQYEYILINPPQTPFQSSKSRLDRNGGPVAIAFYEPVLSYFAQQNPTILYFYHSFMGWPSKFIELLQKYKLKIISSTTIQIHQIHRNTYSKMEQNLELYILDHLREGRADIKYENEVFYVPAVIYCIKPQ